MWGFACTNNKERIDASEIIDALVKRMKKLEDYVVTVPDYPEPGIMFRDITGILQDKDGLNLAINEIEKLIGDVDFDLVLGPESRGFIFGVPIAYNMNKGFVPVRKKGKLPRETVSMAYDLEYGKAEIEIHKDAIKPGQKVVIVDDLIATGGTIEAIVKLVEELGGEVESARIRQQEHHQHGDDGTDEQIRLTASHLAPCTVRPRSDERLDYHSHKRRKYPEETETMRICTKRREYAADIGILKGICDLDSEKSEADIPHLPESKFRFLHFIAFLVTNS